MIKTIKKVAVIIMTVVIMISTVTIADQASSTTVQAASGYSGKIYKHWCKLRTAKSKRSNDQETKCRNKSYSIINKWKLEKN